MNQNFRFSYFETFNPLYFDEERNRFLRASNIPFGMGKRFFHSFITQRPDLYNLDHMTFNAFSVYAWRVLDEFQRVRVTQFFTLDKNYHFIANNKDSDLLNDFFKRRDFCLFPIFGMRFWHWDDLTRMNNWMSLGINRMFEYGLHIPIISESGITKKRMQEIEDEVTDRFVAEMSKPPFVPSQ